MRDRAQARDSVCRPIFLNSYPKLRPSCVRNTLLKWITTALPIQIEDVLGQLVHPSQVGSVKCQMQNHLWSLRSVCDVLPSYAAVGVDFVLAFTSLSHAFISSVLKLFHPPHHYICLVMIVIVAKFIV